MNLKGDEENVRAAEEDKSTDISWYLTEVKGIEEEMTEADIITCVSFNDDGEYLAAGDKGGRVVVFKRDEMMDEKLGQRRSDYKPFCTFVSHESEFDYLKSLEIEEKVNQIKWLPNRHPSTAYLLSTNDKTVKLWKIWEKNSRKFDLNFPGKMATANMEAKREYFRREGYIKLPSAAVVKDFDGMDISGGGGDDDDDDDRSFVSARPKQVYANAHAYHINSISLSTDQETFISADDLRINLWHINITDQSFNIVDMKPTNMEDLTEVITSASYHPQHCSLFAYSSCKGCIRICDLRTNALCDKHSILFEEEDDPLNRSFFSEIINSMSDTKFSHCGRYILSRDYLNLKVWDLKMPSSPIETYPVHDHFRQKLCTLYENDCIFDKFECAWSPNDRYLLTGSYNNFYRVFDRANGKNVTYEVSKEYLNVPGRSFEPRTVCSSSSIQRSRSQIGIECIDYTKKVLHLNWHPKENIISLAVSHNMFLLGGQIIRNSSVSNSLNGMDVVSTSSDQQSTTMSSRLSGDQLCNNSMS